MLCVRPVRVRPVQMLHVRTLRLHTQLKARRKGERLPPPGGRRSFCLQSDSYGARGSRKSTGRDTDAIVYPKSVAYFPKEAMDMKVTVSVLILLAFAASVGCAQPAADREAAADERFNSLENAHRRIDELNAENKVLRDQNRQREMEWDAMRDHVPSALPFYGYAPYFSPHPYPFNGGFGGFYGHHYPMDVNHYHHHHHHHYHY